MRKIKIVADSSSDVLGLENIAFASTSLKIITKDREFIDDENLDVQEMIDYLDKYKGKIQSSCPNIEDWLGAFADADDIICVTITSAMSGSFNAANAAKKIYEEENPDRRVFILDTLSTGPEMRLALDKLNEYVKQGLSFEEMCSKIQEYKKHTGLTFMLKSLKNFANNGRVSHILAKIVGVFGICIVGKASTQGTLEPVAKVQGENKSLKEIVNILIKNGLNKGKVYISHCRNENGANKLVDMIKNTFELVKVKVFECRGLCSFYAENGGLLVGYEKF